MSTNLSFPGRTISAGSKDSANVLRIQRRLNDVGCGPVKEDGIFGPETLDAVELFQSRSVDQFGMPLKMDGRVGPMTWATLFAVEIKPQVATTSSALLTQTLGQADKEVGVREEPLGSNRGPRVDQYLRSVGLDPTKGSFAWCAAFVYFCFDQACIGLSIKNPVVRTAGVLEHWNEAGTRGIHRLSADECRDEPSLVQPGMIFIITTGGGHGHTGLVEGVRGIALTTVEGNTNEDGSREGIGVFRRATRRISDMNRGFIDYGGSGSLPT
jgi:hypothetical protein